MTRSRTIKVGWQIQPAFVVVQGQRSVDVLHRMERFFGCGHVSRNGRHDNHREDLYRFEVRKLSDLLDCIIPFFKVNPLITAKRCDFDKFVSIVAMMCQGCHLTVEGLTEIATIVQTMNHRKPSRFLESSEAIRQPLGSTT